MPGDLWPGQVRSFMEKRDHTYRAIRVRARTLSTGSFCLLGDVDGSRRPAAC